MSQLPLFQPPSWSVADLTRYLRQLLEGDNKLQDVWVIGEVSNCKQPGSGHLYFTLKDSSAALQCVMWRNAVIRQAFRPRDGDAVEAHGSIGVYEPNGVYQLYVDRVQPTGEGILYTEFLRLKARLEAEGLFDPERKRPIPRWPRRIGVVTSRTGAALRDVLDTIRRRYPSVEVILSPTPVQGEDAPFGIVAALRALDGGLSRLDVIILARGGGSIEDLWAFNDERVARTIVGCSVPVISGIGHETDFTIADFAADLRAPTPTAAAELATPHQDDLRSDLFEVAQRLRFTARSALAAPRWQLADLEKRLALRSPRARVRSDRQRLDDLLHRIAIGTQHNLQLKQARLAGFEQRLAALNPEAVLARGYAVVRSPGGVLVKSVRQVSPGDPLKVLVSDGEFNAAVQDGEDRP